MTSHFFDSSILYRFTSLTLGPVQGKKRSDCLRHRAMQARRGPGAHSRLVHEKGLPVIIFFVLPDSSVAQLREPKLALTKLTKNEAYMQLADQKGAARQKALEVQNLIANSKVS